MKTRLYMPLVLTNNWTANIIAQGSGTNNNNWQCEFGS